jgi:hypothetical protein
MSNGEGKRCGRFMQEILPLWRNFSFNGTKIKPAPGPPMTPSGAAIFRRFAHSGLQLQELGRQPFWGT